jgi:hypothetical protein
MTPALTRDGLLRVLERIHQGDWYAMEEVVKEFDRLHRELEAKE